MYRLAVRLCLLMVLAPALPLLADEIELHNGNVVEGTIVKETKDAVVVKTEYGEMTIPRTQIKSIQRIRAWEPAGSVSPEKTPDFRKSPLENAATFLDGRNEVESSLFGMRLYGLYTAGKLVGRKIVNVQKGDFRGEACYRVNVVERGNTRVKGVSVEVTREILMSHRFRPINMDVSVYQVSDTGERRMVSGFRVGPRTEPAAGGSEPPIDDRNQGKSVNIPDEMQSRILHDETSLVLLFRRLNVKKAAKFTFYFLEAGDVPEVHKVRVHLTGKRATVKRAAGTPVDTYAVTVEKLSPALKAAPSPDVPFDRSDLRTYWISAEGEVIQRTRYYGTERMVAARAVDLKGDLPAGFFTDDVFKVQEATAGLVVAVIQRDVVKMERYMDFKAVLRNANGVDPSQEELREFKRGLPQLFQNIFMTSSDLDKMRIHLLSTLRVEIEGHAAQVTIGGRSRFLQLHKRGTRWMVVRVYG